MALLDSAYKQRMVGALVLVALAVIFLPIPSRLPRLATWIDQLIGRPLGSIRAHPKLLICKASTITAYR